MNDDFLHRLRAEPSAKFLATLKASLDRQAIKRAQARRTFFRAAILATLIGGSAVAAFVTWKGMPASARLAARTPAPRNELRIRGTSFRHPTAAVRRRRAHEPRAAHRQRRR